jgi:catechol 2,3-dioxygenase-like lactoylglutathione lyase family enzyme
MFDHIGVRVRDLDKAARLYAAMLAPLGHVAGAKGEGYAGFGPKDKPAFWLHEHAKGGGCHVALRAPDRQAVDKFYKKGLEAGAKDNGAPGVRADYSPKYYAAFLIDLDGNNVEAVCTR